MVTYQGAAFWAHDGFGEYLLARLVDRYSKRADAPPFMKAIVAEATPALEDSWITGTLSSFCDEYVKTPEELAFLLSALEDLAADIAKDPSTGDVLTFMGRQSVLRIVAVEELNALRKLLSGEIKTAPGDAQIFSFTEHTWVTA